MNRFALLIPIAAALCFSSCTSFHREWKEANSKPYEGIEGPWDGTWTSTSTGHTGQLRCVITKKSDEEYEFHYWATWAKILSGSFRVQHKVQVDGGSFKLTGEKDLGALGGVYRFTGTATEALFDATYTADGGDKGTFKMKRPEPAEDEPAKEP